MKDKLKNTLEHEVELLGRSISVLAIAGLLVVGGASAALLNNFGTVTGTADVNDAALYFQGADDTGTSNTYEKSLEYSWDDSDTLGESYSRLETVEASTDLQYTFSDSGDNTGDFTHPIYRMDQTTFSQTIETGYGLDSNYAGEYDLDGGESPSAEFGNVDFSNSYSDSEVSWTISIPDGMFDRNADDNINLVVSDAEGNPRYLIIYQPNGGDTDSDGFAYKEYSEEGFSSRNPGTPDDVTAETDGLNDDSVDDQVIISTDYSELGGLGSTYTAEFSADFNNPNDGGDYGDLTRISTIGGDSDGDGTQEAIAAWDTFDIADTGVEERSLGNQYSGPVSITSGETHDYVFVTDFPINLNPSDTYSLTTTLNQATQ